MAIPSGSRFRRYEVLGPLEAGGLMRINKVVIAPDGGSYAYLYDRVLYSNLYIAEGLK